MSFLPISREEMLARGWDEVDFCLVSGDAYVDHPTFACAVIGRVVEHEGFRVGIIAQPDWRDPKSYEIFGRPRLGFLVSPGNMDSMVNHYTAAKKKRSQDAYSPGGRAGFRPDRATLVYCNGIRKAYGDVPIVIGGVEASLRRFAHYDYWEDRVRRSVLVDAGADLLVFGMGERAMRTIVRRLDSGERISQLRDIPGTCYMAREEELPEKAVILEDFDTVAKDKEAFARCFMTQYREQDPIRGRTLAQRQDKRFLVQNPPALPLDGKALDEVYEYPYERAIHPSYKARGGIPALQEVEFSLLSNRGCFGSCSFCSITFHQGRIVTARTHESLIREATAMTQSPDFKGYIHDVGGPTANFRHAACEKQLKSGTCPNKQCLYPTPCKHLKADHRDYVALLRKLREIPGVKKVFVRSGLRFDYIMADRDGTFLKELIANHISGQLKVAPEHSSPWVLERMQKPPVEVYDRFVQRYQDLNRQMGKDQYLVPYLMSGHPGSDLNAAIALAEYLKRTGQQPEQVQDFYPTPGTLSTCMYHTGIDPRDMKPVYVPGSEEEKAMQRALLQYRDPANYALVKKALIKAERIDLIGSGKKCLIGENPPRRGHAARPYAGKKTNEAQDQRGSGKGQRSAKPGRSDQSKGRGKGSAKARGRGAQPSGSARPPRGKAAAKPQERRGNDRRGRR